MWPHGRQPTPALRATPPEEGICLRKQVFEAMRQAGIGVNVHYIPVHLQPFYRRMGFQEGDFPEAERYYQEALTLPLYYDLTYEEQDYVVNTLDPLLRRGDAKHRGG